MKTPFLCQSCNHRLPFFRRKIFQFKQNIPSASFFSSWVVLLHRWQCFVRFLSPQFSIKYSCLVPKLPECDLESIQLTLDPKRYSQQRVIHKIERVSSLSHRRNDYSLLSRSVNLIMNIFHGYFCLLDFSISNTARARATQHCLLPPN